MPSPGGVHVIIKEGKNAIRWTRLSCHAFRHNAVRLQLHALAYNLANFMRTLALPEEVEHWSLSNPPPGAAAKSVDMGDQGGMALGAWRSMRTRLTMPFWRCSA